MSDKKISDFQGSRRPCHGANRRSFRGNQFTGDEKINQTSSAAKKLKSSDAQDSWCAYKKAEASNKLKDYHHPPVFDQDTFEALLPIYEDLSSDEFLERCLGANTQNNNESFNSCVWMIAPKHMFVGKNVIEIAAFSAAIMFNEGLNPILKVMEVMGIQIGPTAHQHTENVNTIRIDRSEHLSSTTSKEARMAARNSRILENDLAVQEEGIIYGAGIAD